MKTVVKLLLLLSISILFVGCIESTTLIRVSRDGSGEVEETFLMRTDVLTMLMGFAEAPGDENEGESMPVDLEKLERKARGMGEGVSLKSAEELSTEKGQGYRAVFSFTDINELVVNQNPDENVPSTDASGEDAPKTEYITFQFRKGSDSETAVLTIFNPQEEPEETVPVTKEEKTQKAEAADEEMLEMLKEIFRGMRIHLALEVDGTILSTGATYRDGSKVTLIDMDFTKIIENEELFKELASTDTGSVEKTKEIIKDIPGIRVELQDRVEIQFR
jgi:hypothetical protein